METNKKVYYRGNRERGNEIIEALEALGSIKDKKFIGNDCKSIYFLLKKGSGYTICTANNNTDLYHLVISNYTEAHLPEPKVKFKDGDFLTSIYGDYIVIFKCKDMKWFTSYCNSKDECNVKWNYSCFRPSTPEEKQELLNILAKRGKVWNAEKKCVEDKPHKFNPKDWVLVRNSNIDRWLLSIFSFEQHTDEYPFVTIANEGYKQCIPYEGNEHLLGTTNSK